MPLRLLAWIAGVTMLALTLKFSAPARLAALYALGRSPVCPFPNAMQAAEELRREVAAKDRILTASRLLETDAQGFRHWSTPLGEYWIPNQANDYVLPFNLGEQERKIYGSGRHFVQPGDIVIDCGANVGVFVRQALKAGAAKVIAVEPAPENIECLRRNYRAEIASGAVVLFEKGVWDKDDTLVFHVTPGNSAADSFVLRPTGSHEIRIPVSTVDALVAQFGLPKVDFIKMDIEGSEVRALNGARGTLRRWRPRLSISAYHEPSHAVEIPRAVREAWEGYQMECGPCAEAGFLIRPDILWFH